MIDTDHPHAGQAILTTGPAAPDARLAIILLHGRGASAQDILGLAGEFALRDVLYLAPQAYQHTWYPYSFLTPMDRNEPYLSSALRLVGELVASLEQRGMPSDRIGFAGFSQGACLSLEFAARNARRYAGVAGLSGGLIGPPGTPRDYAGVFDGTPVFLGCSDVDAHIPLERVHETTAVLGSMGAVVDERIYPRMGHTVNADEVGAVRAMFSGGRGRP
jgi:predicted esterase